MPLKLMILFCPVQKNGSEIKTVNFIKESIANRGHESVLIDTFKYNSPVDVNACHQSKSNIAPGSFAGIAKTISKADAFIIISEEDNYGIPKPLTDFMEHFMGEYFHRPSGIITYSSDKYGGVRAATQLRSFLSEIGTVSIPATILIPKVKDFFNGKNEPANKDYCMFMNHFLDDLEWYSLALKEGRRKALPR